MSDWMIQRQQLSRTTFDRICTECNRPQSVVIAPGYVSVRSCSHLEIRHTPLDAPVLCGHCGHDSHTPGECKASMFGDFQCDCDTSQEQHPCPYQSDVNDDRTTLCRCGPAAIQACKDSM